MKADRWCSTGLQCPECSFPSPQLRKRLQLEFDQKDKPSKLFLQQEEEEEEEKDIMISNDASRKEEEARLYRKPREVR